MCITGQNQPRIPEDGHALRDWIHQVSYLPRICPRSDEWRGVVQPDCRERPVSGDGLRKLFTCPSVETPSSPPSADTAHSPPAAESASVQPSHTPCRATDRPKPSGTVSYTH